ncbi:MAG TPA: hypothetical protein PK272_07835, partial [Methanoregulaceae archaeon]|nr:hypothetical protein [Methanoregulaceae archaeon]
QALSGFYPGRVEAGPLVGDLDLEPVAADLGLDLHVLAEVFPVAGVTAGFIGLIQATEVCKYLLCRGDLLAGRLLLWDGMQGRIEEIPVETDPDCEACAGKYKGRS